MRSRPTATIALLQLVSIVSVASQPPLDQLGKPFVNTNCAVIWAVTNKLPEKLWVYRVLSSHFSPRVISNLVALGEFSPKEKVENLGWQHNDLQSRCFSNDKRSLGIYPRYGFIEYRYPKANDYKTEEGVPTEEEARRLGTNWIGRLGLDRSQVSQMNVYTPVHIQFRHDPYSPFSSLVLRLLSACPACIFTSVLEGRRIAPARASGWGRKVRTPQGAMPRNLEPPAQVSGFFEIHAGGDAARRPDGQCHRKQTALRGFQISNLKFEIHGG